MLQLTLPPNRTPEIQLYARADGQPVGPRIPGTVVPDRGTLYAFDVTAVVNGDYVLDIFNPWGRVVFRKSDTTYLLADEWWELDYLPEPHPERDPSKVFVNQDYGGQGALTYALDGIPIADATIEVFRYSDYMAGNRNGNYRINNSRQTVDGKWTTAFYLDPEDYVLRYYRTGTAGPDEWKVVVTFNPNDIVITPLDHLQTSAATLRGAHIPQTPPTGEPVTVTQHYSGENALVYQLDGKPVGGATLLVFSADGYNSGNHLQGNAVAATEQDADGNWIRPLTLVPGRYILHCFKRNVAGPNSYNLVVE